MRSPPRPSWERGLGGEGRAGHPSSTAASTIGWSVTVVVLGATYGTQPPSPSFTPVTKVDGYPGCETMIWYEVVPSAPRSSA